MWESLIIAGLVLITVGLWQRCAEWLDERRRASAAPVFSDETDADFAIDADNPETTDWRFNPWRPTEQDRR